MSAVRLQDTSLFKNIREDTVQNLLAHFTEQTLADGQELFHQGEPGDALIVILEGSFDLFRDGATGEVHLATLSPGTVLGHVSLIDSGPRSATLRAAGPGRVTSLDRETFDRLWNDPDPDAVQLQMRVTQLVIKELRVANRKLAGLLNVPLSDAPEVVQRLLGVVDKARRRTGNR